MTYWLIEDECSRDSEEAKRSWENPCVWSFITGKVILCELPPSWSLERKVLRKGLKIPPIFQHQKRGFGFFASVTGVFCYGGLVGGFFATVGVGVFLRQCWGGFLRQWKGFWLRQGGLFASVGVFCDGNRGLLHRHRSAAERSIKKANPCGRLW